jgi:hypothetical protein
MKQLDEGPPIVAPYGMTAHPGYRKLATVAAHVVLLYMVQRGQRDYPDDHAMISVFPGGIAEDMGLTAEAVQAALEELVAAGMVAREEEDKFGNGVYRLLFGGDTWPVIERNLRDTAYGLWWVEYCHLWQFEPKEEERPAPGSGNGGTRALVV